MNTTIYIAQLNYTPSSPQLTEDFVRSLFQPYGKIKSIIFDKEKLIKERKSYAYVTMVHHHEAITAIRELNLKYLPTYKNRVIVKTANPYTNPVKSKPVQVKSKPVQVKYTTSIPIQPIDVVKPTTKEVKSKSKINLKSLFEFRFF